MPAREIIALAQDKGYDLIVMGTHGAGEVAWYMGGVADRVASHATVPVLLLRTLEFKPPAMKEIYSTGARGRLRLDQQSLILSLSPSLAALPGADPGVRPEVGPPQTVFFFLPAAPPGLTHQE